MNRYAYFISPHGFGHATRAAAVMEAILRCQPEAHFDLFTTAPEWLFAASLDGQYTYHKAFVDVGLVQATPLLEDLPASLERVEAIFPFHPAQVSELARQVQALGCTAVLCDIAPLGIAVAAEAGRPSCLVENFTWDWIYANYAAQAPRLAALGAEMGEWFRRATYHIQTEPVCAYTPADMVVGPISRAPRRAGEQVRAELSLPVGSKAVLVGISTSSAMHELFERMPAQPGIFYILTGNVNQPLRHDDRLLLPMGIYYPDLVNAVDGVVAKAGYSSVAEVYRAGAPFVSLTRPYFREMDVLNRFVCDKLDGFIISEAELASAAWLPALQERMERPRRIPSTDASAEVAEFIGKIR